MEISDVNYIPVRVNDLPLKTQVDLSDNLLLARTDTNSMGYSTIKVPYQNLCSNLYEDVYKALSDRISLSVYEDVSALLSNDLQPSWAFGARVIQDINKRLNIIGENYVKLNTDQIINDQKTFNVSPIISDTNSITSLSSATNVEFVRNEFSKMGGSMVFSNDTSSLTSVWYDDPADSSAKKKFNLPTKNYYIYTASNDCILFIWLISKVGANGLTIKLGDDDPTSSSKGLSIQKFPDNDNEFWQSNSANIPVKKGTHIKIVPGNTLWWLRGIVEYSAIPVG